jgi:hypothetical protein
VSAARSTAPAWAVTAWFDGEKFIVEQAGQTFHFDPCEPARITAFLKTLHTCGATLRTAYDAEADARLRFAAAWREKGAEIRAREDARKAREREALLKRADKAQKRKDAIRLLAEVGL